MTPERIEQLRHSYHERSLETTRHQVLYEIERLTDALDSLRRLNESDLELAYALVPNVYYRNGDLIVSTWDVIELFGNAENYEASVVGSGVDVPVAVADAINKIRGKQKGDE